MVCMEMNLPKPSVAAPNVYLGNHSPASQKQRLQRLQHDLKPQCACDIPDHSIERMMDDPIPMPGSFLFDLDQPVPPTLTKARPSLYIPPQSPSAASSLSKSFLSSHIPNSSNGSRKRARYDLSDSTSTDLQQIPQDDGSTDQSWAASTASYDSLRSPTPLVSTKYRLAGGWDTP